MSPGIANAQTAPAAPANNPSNLEEIVITGTQIRGVAPVGSSVIAVGREEITQSGLNTTADIIHDIPQVSGLGAGQNTLGANQSANLNINKANAINIRGLGDQATLTLVDGRRVAPGGPGAQLFDPSSIPTIALRSIDVVADGASATYGSDAVAGVANLVLRTNFEGLEADVRYGAADSYETRKFDVIFGHKWEGGSLMVAGELTNNSQLTEGKRLQYFNCDETAFGGTNNCVKYATPGNITVPAGASIPAGVYGLPAGSGAGVTAAQLSPNINYFNTALDTTLIPKTERKSLVANVSQYVTDGVKLYAEGYFSQNNVSFFNGQFQATDAVKNTNPNFVNLGPAVTSESVTVGLDPYTGPVIRSGYERGYQAVGGADIDITDAIQFNVYYEHLGNDLVNNFNALNATAEATAFACTTPGLCFNPFGNAPGNQAAVNTFLGSQTYTDYFRSDLVNAKFQGTVFTLPGGDVKLAIGTEIHRDSFLTYNTANTTGPTLATNAVTTNTSASRRVYSGYAEAIVPIVGPDNAMPFLNRLQVDLAGRYDSYSDAGTTLNPKYGISYKPVEDFTLHASYGTSFRAPTLCDSNPNCSAAVITAPAYGAGRNVLTIVGGNSGLKPETATTYSVGGEYKPSGQWASFSINYFNINYQNVIGTPAATNPAVFTQPALYASFVTLNPTAAQIAAVTSLPFYTASAPFPVVPGSVTAIVNGTRQNAGAILTDGLDFAAGYDWSSPWGDWSVGATASYILNYNYELLPGSGFINRLNQANYPVSIRGRAKFGWSNEDFGAVAYVNYTGGYNVVQLVSLANGTLQNQPVSAYTTIDTTFLYKLNTPSWGGGYANNITVTLAIQNLLDAKAPFALTSTLIQFDSQQASPLGRMITVGIHKSF